MFRAGSNFKNKTIEEIFFPGFQEVYCGRQRFRRRGRSVQWAQKSCLALKTRSWHIYGYGFNREEVKHGIYHADRYFRGDYLPVMRGNRADQVAEEAFKQEKDGDYYVLKGVVSRKKQIIPPFMSVLQ